MMFSRSKAQEEIVFIINLTTTDIFVSRLLKLHPTTHHKILNIKRPLTSTAINITKSHHLVLVGSSSTKLLQ
jgi:hypothetical protein